MPEGKSIEPVIGNTPDVLRIPEENRPAITTLRSVIAAAAEYDETEPQSSLLFNAADAQDFIGENGAFDPNVGIVKKRTVFSTTRDGWGHGISGPAITGEIDEETSQPVIRIRGNLVAVGPRAPFEFTALPGLEEIRFKSDGSISGITKERETRSLTDKERILLTAVLQAIENKIRIFTKMRKGEEATAEEKDTIYYKDLLSVAHSIVDSGGAESIGDSGLLDRVKALLTGQKTSS